MKKIKYLLLILCLFLISPLNAQGYTVTFSNLFANNGGNEATEEDNKILVNKTFAGENNKTKYICKYSYTVNASATIDLEIYDMDDNEILNNNALIINKPITAGTSVGIYINEKHSTSYLISNLTVTKEVKITTTENVTTGVTCTYTDPDDPTDCPAYTKNDSSLDTNKTAKSHCPNPNPNNENCTVNTGGIYNTKSITTINTILNEIDSGEYYDRCKNDAITTAQDAAADFVGSGSFQTKFTNSNDVSEETITIPEPSETITSDFSGRYPRDTQTINYIYGMKSVCLNPKTANVTYNDANCDDKILVADDTVRGKKHWHYFIPLNSTSDEKIRIAFSKETRIEPDLCSKIMTQLNKDNKKYTDLIVPYNEPWRFVGSIETDKETLKTENGNGCKQVSIIEIPVKQEFYYEEETENDVGTKNSIIQGNKFYFRRIDIEKPFNYKITDPNSLWYDWYNANYDSENIYSMNKVKPNISASFNKVLYYTQNNNIKDIRRYNSMMKYYDWTEMKSNGESCLISDQNGGTNCDSNTAQGLSIAKRNFNSGDDGTPYKLGHGPESTICTVGDKEVAYIGTKECPNAG